MIRKINSNDDNENKNSLEKKEDNENNKNNSEKEESEKEDEKEEESEKESDSNSNVKQKAESDVKNSLDKEKENEEDEEEEENNEEEDNEEEESEKNDNQINKEKEITNNSNNNILKNFKKYEEDKYQMIPVEFKIENKNINILEEYQNNFYINNINNEQTNSKELSKNLKALKEIEQDLTEISDNIEKIFLKLDTSSIHDEKFLIDSLIIEAKKEGILEETFGENANMIQKQEENKISNNNSKIIENEKNNSVNNSKRISMSKIYENNNKENKKKFSYYYNKNRAYYEALNKKMNYKANNMNNINYLKNSLQSQSDLFKSNEKDYFINNNQINTKIKVYNNTNNLNNLSFKNNINLSNNLLSSTDTSGPYRYTRKNMDEPDLMKLLMNK